MLPSPPLTADSGSSSPRSLKRSFTDAIDDATPPPSQPLKRRRCSTSSPLLAPQDEVWAPYTDDFDPSKLVTPPEYAHVPYDPEFGAKVCQQYRKSLATKRACTAVVSAVRVHKYGQEYALAYSPGSTPDHIRRSYEEKQRRLDQLAEDIIANSSSEAESEIEEEQSWRVRMRVARKQKSEFQLRTSGTRNGLDKRVPISRDRPPIAAKVKSVGREQRFDCNKLRRDGTDEKTIYEGVKNVSNGCAGSCTIPAGLAFQRSRRRHRLGDGFRSTHIVAS